MPRKQGHGSTETGESKPERITEAEGLRLPALARNTLCSRRLSPADPRTESNDLLNRMLCPTGRFLVAMHGNRDSTKEKKKAPRFPTGLLKNMTDVWTIESLRREGRRGW